jgi:aspartyl-tRNA(Asn)/glutamyl-tRNA(Gln) amidotransferase subunit A
VLFTENSISSIREKIYSGTLNCRTVINNTIDDIERKNPSLNAFISLQIDAAQKRAEELDSLPLYKKKEKPLLGIPIAVKDNICTKNVPTTCASKMLENYIPPYNATVIDSIEKAGGIIIGKTNLDEFAMGSTSETSSYGVPRNPHNPEYIPGGSSGGSAVAVASHCVPISLGSDTGGSIRQPGSHCGVIGLKPTYGRVSRYGLIAFASSLDQIGPFANHTSDIGLILSVIAGEDKRDSTCCGIPFENNSNLYKNSLEGMTIGIPKEYFGDGLEKSVRNAITAVIDKLSHTGAKFIDVSLPNVQYAVATYYIICTAEASSNLARYDGVKFGRRATPAKSLIDMYKKTRQEGFGAEVKRRIMLGTYVLSSGYYDAYYLKAAKVRTLITKDFENVFEKCDAVISPVTPSPAFKIGERCDDPLQLYLTDIYTVSTNLSGIPGISIPCGKEDERPIGVQFMAPKWREDTLITIANVCQKVTGYEYKNKNS